MTINDHLMTINDHLMTIDFTMQLFVSATLSDAGKAELQQQLPPDITTLFRQDLPESERKRTFRAADFIWVTRRLHGFRNPPTLKFWQLDSAGFDGPGRSGPPIWPTWAIILPAPAQTMMAGILACTAVFPNWWCCKAGQNRYACIAPAPTGLAKNRWLFSVPAPSVRQCVGYNAFRLETKTLARTTRRPTCNRPMN